MELKEEEVKKPSVSSQKLRCLTTKTYFKDKPEENSALKVVRKDARWSNMGIIMSLTKFQIIKV